MQRNGMHSGTSHLSAALVSICPQSRSHLPATVKIQITHRASHTTKGEGEVSTKTHAVSNHQLFSTCFTMLLGIPLVTQSEENKEHTHGEVKGHPFGSSFHSYPCLPELHYDRK